MKQLAIIPGDGIGKEVIAAGMEVLDAVSEISSFQFEPEYVNIGSDWRRVNSSPMRTSSCSSPRMPSISVPSGTPGSSPVSWSRVSS